MATAQCDVSGLSCGAMSDPTEPQEQPAHGPDESASDGGMKLRGPQGCGEWAVVILGVIWLVLLILFVVVLALR